MDGNTLQEHLGWRGSQKITSTNLEGATPSKVFFFFVEGCTYSSVQGEIKENLEEIVGDRPTTTDRWGYHGFEREQDFSCRMESQILSNLHYTLGQPLGLGQRQGHPLREGVRREGGSRILRGEGGCAHIYAYTN